MQTKLTDEEFAETGLDQSFRDFAYWDDDGWLVTVYCHAEALKQLMPEQPTTNPNHGQTQETSEETHQADEGSL